MKVCRTCERPLPPGHAGGSCPACVFGSALLDEPLEPPPAGPTEGAPLELGDYELLGEIGRGGTGVVYRARQRSLNRVVALKTLHGAALTSRDAFARLQTESQAIARLDHPHVVPLYEVGRHAGSHFLTLRYFKHGSLAEALKTRRFTPTEAARLIATAARAVHHAHTRGVLHRDLKPSNFLLDDDGAPHMADFGLAKLADDETSLTLSTSVLGTPAYMAPEQAAGQARIVGTPADIYSLGAVLFELLTGRAPFVGRSALEVLRLVADSEPTRPRTLVPTLDRDLEAVCLRCLEKEPTRRYASAAALADDLDRWLRHEPLSIRSVSPSERAWKWVRRRPVLAGLAAAFLLALLLGIAGVAWQWRRATAASELAQANELAARRNAYLAEMTLANQAFQAKDWPAIRDILDRTQPAPGEPDVRGWEWRYLWSASRSDATPFRERRPGKVYSMAILPDGKQLAVGRQESGFELWDIPTGKLLYSLAEPINRVIDEDHAAGNVVSCRLAVVPGTGLLAYTDCRSPTNAFVRLWDPAARSVVRSMPLPWIPRHLAASPDGRLIACSTMGGDNRVLVFEVASGALLRTIMSKFIPDWSGGHSLVFTADSAAVTVEETTVERRGGLRVVDLATGADRFWLPVDQDFVLGVSVSPDGQWLAATSGFSEGHLRVWNLSTGQPVPTPKVGAISVQFDPTGRRLLVGLGVLRVPGFTVERFLEGEGDGFSAAVIAPDGQTYLSPGNTGELLRWNLDSRPQSRSGIRFETPILSATLLARDRGLFLVSTNGLCHEALTPDFTVHPLPQLGSDARSCASLGSLDLMAIGHEEGSITLHRLPDYANEGFPSTGTHPVTRMEMLDQQGLMVAWCGASFTNRHLQFWNPRKRERVWEVPLPPVDRSFTVSAHDGVVYEIFSDHLIGFDAVHRRTFRRELDHQGAGHVSFSPDGRWAFSSNRGYAGLLDGSTLRTVERLSAAGGVSHGSAFHPTEPRLLLSGGRVVDLLSRRLLLTLGGGFGFIQDPAVSPGGGIVGEFFNDDRSIVLWRAPSWEEIRLAEAADGK